MPAYKTENKKRYAKFSYKNWKGELKFTTKRGFATKSEALQYEHDYKMRLSKEIDMTFEDFVKEYRDSLYPRIRISTAASKDNVIDTKIIPYFRNFQISKISSHDIIKWQNELISFKNPKTGKPYSSTYLRTINNQMSAIMNFAVRFYNLSENPVKKAGSIGIKNAKEMNFWTFEEYSQFSEAMMDEPLFYYCFQVLYWTGIREGELLALTYNDFDLQNKTISINKTYQVVNGQEITGPPKTVKGIRTINIPDMLCDEMKEYFKMCYEKKGRIFPISNNVLRRAMERGIKHSGVKKIRIHDLRHSHISLLINLGYSAVDIAKRVGHESITITLNYAHMFPSVQEKITNELNGLMCQKR